MASLMRRQASHSETPSSKGTNTLAANRMSQLRDKMVLKIVQTWKSKHTGYQIDSKSVDVVRHQLGMMLDHGPVNNNDLSRLEKLMKPQERPAAQKSSNRSYQVPSQQADALSEFAATFGGSMAKKEAVDPKSATMKNHDISKIAQEVRSLPPLVQRRMQLKQLQKPWMEKMDKDLEEHKQLLEAQKERKVQLTHEQKEFLDAQVMRHEEQKRLEKERAKILALEEANQREIWKGEAQASARRRKNEITNIQDDLKHQRELALQKKLQDQERRRLDEAEKVRRLHEEMEEEEQEKERRKEKAKVEREKFLAYNKGIKEARDMEKKRIKDQDIEFLKAYEEKLAKQERDREEALQKLSAKQAKQYALASAQHQNIQALAQADEMKALREQEKLERKLKDDEDRKKQKQMNDRHKMKAVVAQQIAEKEDEKRRAKEEAQRLKDEMIRSVAVAEEKERVRRQQQRQFALQGLREIDQQLVEQHERRFKPTQIKVGKE